MNTQADEKPQQDEKDTIIIPARPAPEQAESKAEEVCDAKTTAAENTPADTEAPAAEEKAAQETTMPESAASAESEGKSAETATSKRSALATVALDTLLVLMLAGTIGGGCWYLNQELNKYRVPSPMELAAQENLDLCREREALQAPAYHADEQLHMRRRLANLVRREQELRQRIDEKRREADTQQQKVLAVQHDIRQEDKTSRSVAKGLLPGMPIGDATTTTGKQYRNAVIHRLEGRRITLRTPEGQATFATNLLVKDTLPDLARYAFGLDDMVDMSDFEVTADQPAPKARKGKLITPKSATEPKAADTPADYEPAAGAPVVDTDANRTSTWTGEGEDAPSETSPTGTWQPPTGDLPF